MKANLDVHEAENVNRCTEYIQKLKDKYWANLDRPKNLEEIKSCLNKQLESQETTSPPKAVLEQAKKTYEKYVTNIDTAPQHQKNDSQKIKEIGVDFKTALALEWLAIIDPRNCPAPSDLLERQIMFLKRLAEIEAESNTQGRPYISDMGFYERICVDQAYHSIFLNQILPESAEAKEQEDLATAMSISLSISGQVSKEEE